MPRKWLQTAIESEYLPQIEALKNTPSGRRKADALNLQIRQQWFDRGFTTLLQQQSLMDDTRRSIKNVLGEGHWILEHIRFTTEEYTDINSLKQQRVSDRNEATQQLLDPDAIVSAADRLLDSPSWSNIAAGLAVVTGRRAAEILSTAHFELHSPWSVVFSGALKRRGEPVALSFEIPTLTNADRVISSLQRLRAELPEAVGMAPREINKKYEAAVASVCDRSFASLVPTRDGQDNLYTHLFRAVYATIATFWYCPPSVNDTEFKAAIQGHYSIRTAENDDLQRSLAASRHYSDYEISDREIARFHGQRKGVRLGLDGVLPLQQFRSAMPPSPSLSPRRSKTSFRLWDEDKQRLEVLLAGFSGSQYERFHAFLDELESSSSSLPTTPSPVSVSTPPVVEVIPVAPIPQDSKFDRLLDAVSQLVGLQQSMLPALAQSPPPPAPKTRQRSDTAAASSRIDLAINAIFAYNNLPGRKHHDKWAIGINTLKSFVKNQEAIVSVIGGRNRKGESVVGSRQEEIRLHHQLHQLDPDKHNYFHRGKAPLSELVSID